MRTPLGFAPGSRYQYSSMGILLAAQIGELLGGSSILKLVDRAVFQPLGMKHSAQGLGRFKPEEMVPCQMEAPRPSRGAATRTPGSGTGTAPTGGSWAPLGRDPRLGPRCRQVPGRVPGGPRPGRQAGDGPADDPESQPGGTHAARAGIRRGRGVGQPRVFGADLRPYRLDGHALLGRPGERHHLRRAHVAAGPRGETAPARPRGGEGRGRGTPLIIGWAPSRDLERLRRPPTRYLASFNAYMTPWPVAWPAGGRGNTTGFGAGGRDPPRVRPS